MAAVQDPPVVAVRGVFVRPTSVSLQLLPRKRRHRDTSHLCQEQTSGLCEFEISFEAGFSRRFCPAYSAS